MNRHDLEFEKFIVSASINLSFHGFDFIVGAFKRAVERHLHNLFPISAS
jgi:hypothetical protein